MYPPNEGFKQIYETLLVVGVLIDRYGPPSGKYASPYGTPFYQRSIPFTTSYSVYKVVKPVHVMVGHSLPWFGFVGCGLQYKFFKSIDKLLEEGVLEKI